MLPDINDKENVLEYLEGLKGLVYSFYIPTNLKPNIKEVPLIISGNDNLIDLVERDIAIVKQAIQDQNPKIRYLNIYSIAPLNIPFGIEDKSIYERLLNEKFENANTPNIRYTDKKMFSELEAINFEKEYAKYFDLLPILKQWVNYLKEVAVGEAKQQDEFINTPDLETIVNKYVLLDQLGIVQFLKDKHGFDEMKQTDKIALLSMILGLDKKGESSIKGILSSPRSTDKNYPLKDKNIKTVQSKLTELGIMKVKPVKGFSK